MLIDTYGRSVDYIRISVTSRCNFKCAYCMPCAEDASEDALSLDELFFVASVAVKNGIKKIRITGGEPLLRKDLPEFIQRLHTAAPHVEINLTTNGYLLQEYATTLARAGLKRVNVSLDTLDPVRFKLITKYDALQRVLGSIGAAGQAGLKIKLNTVVMGGINDDEIISLLEFAGQKRLFLRFIEFMPNVYASGKLRTVTAKEILQIIGAKYEYKKIEKDLFGPASLFELKNGQAFGIIEPHKDDFCKTCNRLRLTANGNFVPCLFYDDSLNVKNAAAQKDASKIEAILKDAVMKKPEKNLWTEQVSNRAFWETGG